MSNYVGYALKASKSKTGQKIISKVKDFFKSRGKNPTPGVAIKNVPLSPNLQTKRNIQDQVVAAVDKGIKKGSSGAPISESTKQYASKLKKDKSKQLKDYSYTADKITEKKAKGGRIGYKRGTNLGMQSVKYGLDNKPEVTKLDRIAKFIAKDKNKKKIAKKFKTPMEKAIKKNKKKII
jgi:hypothetical protein